MEKYETLVVIDPALEDAKKEAAIERVKEVISSEGTVETVDVWGLRKLAYPIQKKNEGYYALILFEAEPTLPFELDRRLKISDDFMRHIIVRRDENQTEIKRPAAAPVDTTPVYEAKAPVEAEEETEEFEEVEAEAAVEAVEEAEAVEEVAEAAEEAVQVEETVEEAVEETEEAVEAE